ncbi:MAG: hypothetical protein HY830_15095 [Actinobacteria bacterium]|nr:hypothetical protein [Actinomycetota bacterium]
MSTTTGHEPARVPGRRPLAVAGWGLLLVGLDLRVNGLDVLPDVVGWALLLVAALRLAEIVPATGTMPTDREPGRRRLAVLTAVAAGLAGALSLPWVTETTAAYVAWTVAVGLLLRLVAVQAAHAGDAESSRRWNRLLVCWAVSASGLTVAGAAPGLPVLLGAGWLGTEGTLAVDGAVLAVVLVLVVVLLGTLLVATVGLFRDSWRPWARPPVVTAQAG